MPFFLLYHLGHISNSGQRDWKDQTATILRTREEVIFLRLSEATLLIMQTCSIFHLVEYELWHTPLLQSYLSHELSYYDFVCLSSPERPTYPPILLGYQRVSPSIENWSYFSAGGNIFDIWLFKCTLAVFLFIEAQSWECSPTLRTPRKAPRSDRLSSVEKWQDNPMEGKWSELISYNGQKKEMDCGRGERV